MTLKELFDNSCTQYANRSAISYVNGNPLTYAEMKQEVTQTTALLCRMGICKGDRVAILSSNQPNWCITFFAVTCMGAIAVPILPDFHPDEVKNILLHSGSKAIFVSQKFTESVAGLANETLTHVVLMDDFSLISGELTEAQDISWEAPVESDTASIIYTSGTTGRSKGVMLSHLNITSNAEACMQIEYVVPEDVFLSILPLSHSYENTIAFIMPIMQGSSIYYLDKPPTPAVLIPALQKTRPTIMFSVPLIIEKIYRSQVQAKFTQSKLLKLIYEHVILFRKLVHYLAGKKLNKTFGGRMRFFGIGGAKLDATVERFLSEARFPYAIGYGLTETSPLIAGSNPAHTCFQGIGPVLKGVQVKIDTSDPHKGIGEVLVKGPNVMQGYYREPELTRNQFTEDGWLRTGDLGHFDRHMRLYLKGRQKNMIVGANGENIYPEDIEAVINNIRGVLESLVLEKKGKLVAMVCLNIEELEKSYLQLRNNTIQFIAVKKEGLGKQKEEWNKHLEAYISELKNHVNRRLNRFSQIHSVIVVPVPFQKTPTMKIKRYLYQ